ncbi:MAG: hypothetical protein QOG53_1747 [Frankiales bacterium]|jgi:hypothetical protein|nr:hypothetical protein [Frankiales bacterium]
MGRGRAKAKQTKVARQLKYTTTGTDLDRLRAELSGDETPVIPANDVSADDNADDDPYAAYVDEDDDEEDDAEAHRAG